MPIYSLFFLVMHGSHAQRGLHGFWVELQSIRNRRPKSTPFFSIERFSKYLEVVCSEILTRKVSENHDTLSLGIHAISLQLDGEYLILMVEEKRGEKKTPRLLHKFSGPTSPYLFLKKLIDHPDNDCSPSDLKMYSNSPSNLLDRAKIKGTLRKLFFKKGIRKGSIQLPSSRIILKDAELGTRLSIEKQLEEMDLSIYSVLTESCPR